MGATESISIANDIAEITKVTAFVEAFCGRNGLSDTIASRTTLVLDELLTNTISYGFPDGGRHAISVALSFEDCRLSIEMVDAGIAFDPLVRPKPDVGAALDGRPIGGLGIHIVKTLMDRVDYRRENDQNRLTLTKMVSLADDD